MAVAKYFAHYYNNNKLIIFKQCNSTSTSTSTSTYVFLLPSETIACQCIGLISSFTPLFSAMASLLIWTSPDIEPAVILG